jgi:hypothetical protein
MLTVGTPLESTPGAEGEADIQTSDNLSGLHDPIPRAEVIGPLGRGVGSPGSEAKAPTGTPCYSSA